MTHDTGITSALATILSCYWIVIILLILWVNHKER